MKLSDRRKLERACKLAQITRVTISPRHPGLQLPQATRDAMRGREMWFGPNRKVLGHFTPEEGLAKLHETVARIDAERDGNTVATPHMKQLVIAATAALLEAALYDDRIDRSRLS